MNKSLNTPHKRGYTNNVWPRRSALTLRKLAGSALCLISGLSNAEDIDWDRWWFQTGGITHHISNDTHRNGANYGLGLEYKFFKTQSIRTGIFRNSYDRDAPYFSYVWLPWNLGSARVGANVAAAGGYSNRTGALVAVIPWGEIT